MLTYVTAFYPTRTDVSISTYIECFQRLVETGIALIVFLPPDAAPLSVPPTVRVLRRPLLSIVPEGVQPRLPVHRNGPKDTVEFLCLILHKLYFLTEALKETDSSHLAWIDFRIFHVIRHPELAQLKLRALTTRTFPGLTKLLSPGCWPPCPTFDIFSQVCWRYCGGLVLGPRAAIEPAYRRQMELVYENLPSLTWEVNYWSRMEDHFEWYAADHDDSIVMNLPYSPRILRPRAEGSAHYVDGGQYRRIHVGKAIEQALFSAFCDTSVEGTLVIPKTDMVVAPAEYHRMKRSVSWDDPAISEEGTFPRGSLLCLDTSRGISETGVLYYPLDDETFETGLREMTGPDWNDRIPRVVWRGGTSGVERPSARQRVVASLLDSPHADVKFVRGGWPQNDAEIPDAQFGERISFADHLRYKYMLSIDGNGAASSLQWIFATGCVPILVMHPEMRCWLTDSLIPMVHYVPVAYDLSTLHATLEWLVTHDDDARRIAEQARVFARTMLSREAQHDYLRRKIHEKIDRRGGANF